MKNITLSAQEEAIEKARRIASSKHRTLNEMFREWLDTLNHTQTGTENLKKFQTIWKKTNYMRVGKKLSRNEMNER
jgi:hypothetical protein